MYKLKISDDKTAIYMNPCKRNGSLFEQLRELGCFIERKSDPETVTIPLSSKTALALRHILVGVPLEISNEFTKKTLTEYANNPSHSSYNIFPSVVEGKAIIDAQDLTLQKFSALRKALGSKEYYEVSADVFMLSIQDATDVHSKCSFLNTHHSIAPFNPFMGLDTIGNVAEQLTSTSNTPSNPYQKPQEARVAPNSRNATTSVLDYELEPQNAPQRISLKSLEPFTSFDGTLASLRWVPLEAYEYIRKDSEKTAKSNRGVSEHNKKQTLAKNKKKLKRSLAQRLSSMGMSNAFDVLHLFPLRYIDRSTPKILRQLTQGEEATILATVVSTTANHQKRYAQITFEDMIQSKFTSLFMNQTYLAHMYKKGDQVMVTGKVSSFNGRPTLNNARVDKLGGDRAIPMIPVYPQSGKNEVSTWDMYRLMEETLSRLGTKKFEEPLSPEIMAKYQIPSRTDAYQNIHFPVDNDEFKNSHRRLVYEELFRLQLMIQQQRQDITKSRGIIQNTTDTPTVDYWVNSLPYELTGAQKRAITDIKANMGAETPMYRLVQGDVGAGKTSICLWTVLNSLDNGYQSAVLAPTEILAEQLYNGLKEPVEGLLSPRTGEPLRVEFLAGKATKAQAKKIREGLADGSIDIAVGTHSLLTEDTTFKNLGTVVIDEQHRFGVEQRSVLRKERADGRTPDMLLMTATPIPRSSTMVLYGDLDLTILDELPPGRVPIETIWQRIDAQQAVGDWTLEPWNDIRNEVAKGHQAYIVASLVEDNEKVAAQSVMDAYDKLSTYVFPGMRLGVVHGKQKRAEREEIMTSFAKGEIDVLIATTVIEVGVNVPNSTVMVVLDPGRFGISQLHQIRGRVGRSTFPSRCWLVGDTKSDEGEFRLNALVESTDGFYLSEKDLELRGEGTLFSTKQSGQSDLFLAKIREHMNVLEVARDDARELLEKDPKLQSLQGRIFSSEMEDIFGDKEIKS